MTGSIYFFWLIWDQTEFLLSSHWVIKFWILLDLTKFRSDWFDFKPDLDCKYFFPIELAQNWITIESVITIQIWFNSTGFRIYSSVWKGGEIFRQKNFRQHLEIFKISDWKWPFCSSIGMLVNWYNLRGYLLPVRTSLFRKNFSKWKEKFEEKKKLLKRREGVRGSEVLLFLYSERIFKILEFFSLFIADALLMYLMHLHLMYFSSF